MTARHPLLDVGRSRPGLATRKFPAVDDRLIAADTGYELIDGVLVEVTPCYEPHGNRHSKLLVLLEAYVVEEYTAACDMLTRASEKSDFAPDACIYPIARDPETGGRQLEALAFEVMNTETPNHAGAKARELIARGVRRVFAIDVNKEHGLEWSADSDEWEPMDPESAIDDPTLVMPLPVRDLVHNVSTDDAVARALLAKRNRVLTAQLDGVRTAGKAEAIIAVLVARGLPPTDAQRKTIVATTDPATIARWLAVVATCASVSELLDAHPG
ncbi:MAG: Uma2 family endonuclease [Myxococcota bacterium]